MSKIASKSALVVRHAGNPASFTTRVGNDFSVVFVYQVPGPDGNLVSTSLDGFELTARCVFHHGEFGSEGDDEGRLTRLGPAALASDGYPYPPKDLTVTAFPDQSAAPGQYSIRFPADLLPEGLRTPDAEADMIPCAVTFVRMAKDGDVDQVAIVGGYRFGFGSIAEVAND